MDELMGTVTFYYFSTVQIYTFLVERPQFCELVSFHS